MSHAKKHRSHPDKWLEIHINGVIAKTGNRTASQVAYVAALFHDLGKLNPNFQRKLFGKVTEYSNHSLLSAVGLVCFMEQNRMMLPKWFGEDQVLKLKMVLAIIIAHHGNLSDFGSLRKPDAENALLAFLQGQTDATLPAAGFLKVIFQGVFAPFSIFKIIEHPRLWNLFHFGEKEEIEWKNHALDYFLETQFSFAALIESDKRDAGNNEDFYLSKQAKLTAIELNTALDRTFAGLTAQSELNLLRTAIREDSVAALKIELANGRRVFSLTAPTGAGKTYTLLALAKEIQQTRPEVSVLYALPFLSIIEQVEDITRGLFSEENAVLAFHSKSVNTEIESAQKELETDQSDEKVSALLKYDFAANTFDHPFIVTTFVQFFETLMSNHNSTLLKLPNFQKRIFLIDEIQALPPRLYLFFAGWLDAFCQKFDAYCVLSTATMPHWEIAEFKQEARQLFKDYQPPVELLNARKFFIQKPFNRYLVAWMGGDSMDLDELATEVKNQSKSCLVILNTIDDTKQLYEKLKDGPTPCILLNTHFIPQDRRAKIEHTKSLLNRGKKVTLISTQLIEAGVDVDFPVIYRDLCPLPSLIQSAGRCNRNGKLDFGQVYFLRLKKDNGKYGSSQVYREADARQFLEFSLKHIKGKTVEERDLFEIQKVFFKKIGEGMTIGEYKEGGIDSMIDCVNKAKFRTLGRFQLIPERTFGSTFTYYVPDGPTDERYFDLENLVEKLGRRDGFIEYAKTKLAVQQLMKKMANRMLNIRLFDPSHAPQPQADGVMGIRCLQDPAFFYSPETGIKLGAFENSII